MSNAKFYVGDIVYFKPIHSGNQVYFMKISHLTNRVAAMIPIGILYNSEDQTVVPDLSKFKKMGYRALGIKPKTGWNGTVDGCVSESRCKINLTSYYYDNEEVHLWDGAPIKQKE